MQDLNQEECDVQDTRYIHFGGTKLSEKDYLTVNDKYEEIIKKLPGFNSRIDT